MSPEEKEVNRPGGPPEAAIFHCVHRATEKAEREEKKPSRRKAEVRDLRAAEIEKGEDGAAQVPAGSPVAGSCPQRPAALPVPGSWR